MLRSCTPHAAALFVRRLVRGERGGESGPAGSISPRGECWLMNRIFLTRGRCLAAALSQRRRAPVFAPCQPCSLAQHGTGCACRQRQQVLRRRAGEEGGGGRCNSDYEQKPPDKFDYFSLWVSFASHKQPPAECCCVSLTYVVIMRCKLSISFFLSCFCCASFHPFCPYCPSLFLVPSPYFINMFSFSPFSPFPWCYHYFSPLLKRRSTNLRYIHKHAFITPITWHRVDWHCIDQWNPVMDHFTVVNMSNFK